MYIYTHTHTYTYVYIDRWVGKLIGGLIDR